MRRFLPTFIISLLINLFLFLIMKEMVTADNNRFKESNEDQAIEFIRYEHPEELSKVKTRLLPKKPPPRKVRPKIKPKLPKRKLVVRKKPKIDRMPIPIPTMERPPEVKGQPFLGKFLPEKVKEKIVQNFIEPEVIPVRTEIKPVVDAPPVAELVNTEEIPLETNVIPFVRVSPRYPRRALKSQTVGVVVIEFTISPDGSVLDPLIVKSEPRKVFDRAVLRALKKWKFKPKFQNGKPVKRRARQEFTFSLKEG
ncbi:MAG: TonB family protein [Nitrospiria bacterium]